MSDASDELRALENWGCWGSSLGSGFGVLVEWHHAGLRCALHTLSPQQPADAPPLPLPAAPHPSDEDALRKRVEAEAAARFDAGQYGFFGAPAAGVENPELLLEELEVEGEENGGEEGSKEDGEGKEGGGGGAVQAEGGAAGEPRQARGARRLPARCGARRAARAARAQAVWHMLQIHCRCNSKLRLLRPSY